MATAPAVREADSVWHARGTWSPRDDRGSFAVWLGVLWVGMIAGFAVDFPRYLHENPPAPKVTYFHGAVFTGWLLILTAQVLMILKDRIAGHRRLGWFAAGWACLMAVMGPWAALSSDAVNLHLPSQDTQFISVNIVDVGGFLLLLAWGIALRRNPAAHKRMMILATVSLADPGFARFSGWLWPTEPKSVVVWFFWLFYGNVLLVALGLVARTAHAAVGNRGRSVARRGVSGYSALFLGTMESTHAPLGGGVGEADHLESGNSASGADR